MIPDYNAIAEHIEIVEYETNGIAFYCQHGSKECRGNMFQACAIDQASSNWTRILPLIDCMETNFYKRSPTIDSITKECADNNDFEYKELLACASGAHGQRLMYDIGKKTKALRPRLNFVPTVVFNNSYSDEIK